MSLYRNYRPQSFADVIGQDHVVTTLENAAEQGKLSHAYLFAGSRGTGKTSVARILAKSLMTQGITDTTLRKHIEKGIEEGSIVDLLEIDAASNRGIDDIRDLVEKIQFSPVVASAKVYIIDEVHMLTKEAFNALLKTLEEPPQYAYFILATTELNKIPVTIQSRCQCFPFRHIRDDDIIRRLQYIADCEKISVERDALRTIARHVEGGMRDAISLLDQLRSLPKITVEDVHDRIGSTGHEQIETILHAIDTGNSEELLATVRALEERGIPADVFLRQLLQAMRQRLHEAVNERQGDVQATTAMLELLLRTLRDVRTSPLPAMALEAALLRLSTGATEQHAAAPKPPAKVAKPVKEEKPKASAAAANSRKNEDMQEETAVPAAVEVEAEELTLENIREHWDTILRQTEPPSVRMSLKDGRVQEVAGNTITVSFASAFHRDKVAGTDASRTIEGVMEKIFKRSLRLKCTIAERDAAAVAQETVNVAEAAAEIF